MRFGTAKGGATSKSPPPPGNKTRHSSGLDQFSSALAQCQNHSILDLSGASQANISFVTGLGHRISSDDMVGTMEECFGRDYLAGQRSAANSQRFLDQTLTFPDNTFDGALIWDALQFLSSPLLEDAISQLMRVMRPGALMLAFFNADERAQGLPVYNYRIQDQKTLLQVPRNNLIQQSQFFPNRTIEKLFDKAQSLKFFLTRDSMREVLIRR